MNNAARTSFLGYTYAVFDNNIDMLYTILGKPHRDLGCDQMMAIWLIILRYVPAMYRKNVNFKTVWRLLNDLHLRLPDTQNHYGLDFEFSVTMTHLDIPVILFSYYDYFLLLNITFLYFQIQSINDIYTATTAIIGWQLPRF